MVLCIVWVIELLPMHAVFECFAVLKTESPCDCRSIWCCSRWQEGVLQRPQWTTV